ncbi:cytidylyltransferase domain-containing protein [Methanoregula sp. UBA64]|jgi:CMP-N,N'-diacetyllegionaminic acid synthase|uniref:acylneuraminate cytidylyltransferase family protein n=1 Tax=Methanoregula sp. UBA64 TaxID=1915554 RepID=UPI0025FA64D0|nr:acylneuraminate cytidylyltransferase family protein [Methanoregula sp. UBA64]
MKSKILAIIPARGGSKGIPQKNIKLLLGKPLIVWTIEQALLSEYIDRVFVSTDDPEIASVARDAGADIPFLRPKEFAQDNSPTSDAVIHALDVFEKAGESFDIIVLLEPTSPLRENRDIDNAIESFLRHSPDISSLVSVGEVHLENPYIMKTVENNCIVPLLKSEQVFFQRQQLPEIFFPYGVIYMSSVPAYRQWKTFYQNKTLAYKIARWQNYEIDDIYDFYCVEAIMKNSVKEAGK